MEETGDYQVRVITPSRLWTPVTTRDVLVSRGGLAIGGINFGLRLGGRLFVASGKSAAHRKSKDDTDERPRESPHRPTPYRLVHLPSSAKAAAKVDA